MEIVKLEKPDLSRACATCSYWSPRDDPRAPERIGECRFDTPKTLLVPVATMQGQGISVQSVFPATVEACWCGNHPLRKGSR